MVNKLIICACVCSCLTFSSTLTLAMPDMNSKSQSKFDQADTNKDKKLSLEEFTQGFSSINQEAFHMINKDGDDFISADEWTNFINGHESMQKPSSPAADSPLLIEPPKDK